MSRRVRIVLVSMSLVMAIGAATVPSASASDAGRALVTVSRNATFSTQGQSLWGRGTQQAISGNFPFFDKSWNESGSVGGITNICWAPNPFGGCFSSGDFGATLGGSTSGRVGLGVHYQLDSGALAIDYPMRVNFRMPQKFRPGSWFTIGSSGNVLPNAQIETVAPDGSFDLNGVFGFSAHTTTKACLVTCTETSPGIDIPTTSGTIFTFNSDDVHFFTNAELQQLGLSGFVQLPDFSVGDTTVNPDGSLSASGSDDYAELGISAIEWGFKLAGLELPLNLDLPLCCGMHGGWTSFDSTFAATAAASQALDFAPSVAVSLKLPKPMDYVIVNTKGNTAGSGRSDTVSFPVGYSARLHIPSNQVRALRIVPTARMLRSTIHSATTTEVSFNGNVSALAVHAGIPEFDVAGVKIFDAVDVNLGPVYDQDYPIANLPAFNLKSGQWDVAGFHDAVMTPLVVNPV